MKKVKGLTNRIAAMLLSGVLVVGLVPGIVFASDIQTDIGQTPELAAEEMVEMPSEDVPVEDSVEVVMGSEEVSPEEYSEDAAAQEEEAVAPYTVTLDANGGYFANEWDDALGETVETSYILTKAIPVGGVVTTFPVREQKDVSVSFLGWSFERDGEIVSQGYEEYAPVENCVLFAVWGLSEAFPGDTEVAADEDAGLKDMKQVAETAEETAGYEYTEAEESGFGDTEAPEEIEFTQEFEETETGFEEIETAEEIEAAQEYEETKAEEAAQGFEETEVAEDTYTALEIADGTNVDSDEYTAPETDNEQDTASAREDVYSDEEEEEELLGSSAETNLEFSGEEETVREYAANYIVDSGTYGDNLTWTLDGEGTLTISGKGEMTSYYTSPFEALGIETVIIEDGVTSVGDNAFSWCDSLKNIQIPETVTSIRDYAFYDCSGLTSITIPGNDTWIGDSAFYGCSGLTSITIPGNVTIIGDSAFYGCSSLRSITIPGNVTSIGDSAFYGCSSLTSITIPDTVTNIGHSAFYDCSSLTNITIPDSVTSIGHSAFYNCSSLTNITIPGSVTWINSYTFCDCNSLTSIEIQEGVTEIWYSAFSGCSNLPNITIPDSVTRIENYAFSSCSSLTSITIPNSVIDIEFTAFDLSDNITINCYIASFAHEYALVNNIPVSLLTIDNDSICVKGTNEEGLNWSIDSSGVLRIEGKGEIGDNGEISNQPWKEYNQYIKGLIVGSGIDYIGCSAFEDMVRWKKLLYVKGLR